MGKFKAGDRIRMKRSCSGAIQGKIYTLTQGLPNGRHMDCLWACKGKIRNGKDGCR